MTDLDKRNIIAAENQKFLMKRTIVTRLGAFLLTAVILFGSFGSSFGQLAGVSLSQVSIDTHDDQSGVILSQKRDADSALVALLSLAEKSEIDEDEVIFQSTFFSSASIITSPSFQIIDHFTSCLLIETKKYILYHSLKIPYDLAFSLVA